MKKVSNNSQLAHVWAQQSQPEGRGSSFYFRGATLYSYGPHFIVGEACTGADGSRVFLLNCASYSSSTDKHKAHAHRAVHGIPGTRYFNVPEPTAGNVPRLHPLNVQHFRAAMERALLQAARARKNASWYCDEARRTWQDARDYCATFGLAFDIPEPDTSTPALQRALARETERRAAEREAERARDAERAEAERDSRERWRQGASLWSVGGPTMLRLSSDGETVQTSRGAEIPAEHARHAWPLIAKVAASGKEWIPGDMVPRLGQFTLDRINADGSIRAGCHTLEFAELQHCARLLGVTE